MKEDFLTEQATQSRLGKSTSKHADLNKLKKSKMQGGLQAGSPRNGTTDSLQFSQSIALSNLAATIRATTGKRDEGSSSKHQEKTTVNFADLQPANSESLPQNIH